MSVREDGGDPVAAGALEEDNDMMKMITLDTCLDVHEEGVWMLHQPLEFVPPLLG